MADEAATPNWDEIAINAEALTEEDAADEFLAEQKAKEGTDPDGNPPSGESPSPSVTGPVTDVRPKFDTVNAPISELAQRAAQAGDVVIEAKPEDLERVKDYVEQPEEIDVADAPVANSPEPIKLVEEIAPRLQEMRVMRLGNIDVIATPERIEFIRAGAALPEVKAPEEKPTMPKRIADHILVEQEAGRRALERHAANAAFRTPKPAPKPTSTAVYRPGSAPMQHLLNKPAVAGKSGGY